MPTHTTMSPDEIEEAVAEIASDEPGKDIDAILEQAMSCQTAADATANLTEARTVAHALVGDIDALLQRLK